MSNALENLIREELRKCQMKVSALQMALEALQEEHGPAQKAEKRRGKKKAARNSSPSISKTMTTKEAVAYTGLHQTTLSKMKREGVLRGDRGVFDRESLDLMMEARNSEKQ